MNQVSKSGRQGKNLSTAIISAACTALLLSACGGGSGGSDSVRFSGSVNDTADEPARHTGGEHVMRAISGMQVCALGSCALTGADGRFSFEVPDESYAGGDVPFQFTRDQFAGSALVTGLVDAADNIEIDFSMSADGTMSPLLVLQDGVQTFPDDPLLPNDGEDGDDSLEGLSESERACKLIQLSNIAITNAVTTVNSTNDPANCPQAIPDIIAVGNPGTFAFEYQVNADVQDITVSPAGGLLMPGEIARHDGSYRCTSAESFDTLIDVSVTTIIPNDGSAPINAADATVLCGPNANAGNLIDSSPIVVNIQN